jgi:alkanesulfonate monooxygenase SsuD/methylene tetrahydromethanopterin reductase-like flavin-dependent oxidoreductase (luciferase family)
VEVGIGYPGMCPDVGADILIPWARRAESAGFSSLSSGERVVYSNPDLMVTMATVGAVTNRIRLMTTVCLMTLHGPSVIAKQAATLDVMTEGRFVLGVGAGPREDDFEACGIPFDGRGERLAESLMRVRDYWSAEDTALETWVGPRPLTPGGPRILIGPGSEAAARRVVLADGIVTFGLDPDPTGHVYMYTKASDAWSASGLPGRPYFAGGAWFAMGPRAEEKALEYLHDYYGFMGDPAVREMLSNITLIDESNIKETLERFEQAGLDEFFFSPLIAELDQVDRLAELVL